MRFLFILSLVICISSCQEFVPSPYGAYPTNYSQLVTDYINSKHKVERVGNTSYDETIRNLEISAPETYTVDTPPVPKREKGYKVMATFDQIDSANLAKNNYVIRKHTSQIMIRNGQILHEWDQVIDDYSHARR